MRINKGINKYKISSMRWVKSNKIKEQLIKD